MLLYETITIYDTLFVYDTVRIRENIKDISFAPESIDLIGPQADICQRHREKLIFPLNETATISNKSIILNENSKNSESMKRTGLIATALFAVHTFVTAQTNFGITAAGGFWWAKCNESIVKSETTPSMKAGLFLEHSFNRHLFLKTEVNYNYLSSNYSYKAVVDPVNWLVVGETESTTPYHQISIPVNIGYKLGTVKPYLGFEYSYRISDPAINKRFNLFGLSGGINFTLSDDISLGVNYYHGLTKDYSYKGKITDPLTQQTVGQYNDYWKSSRIELALSYTFKMRQKIYTAAVNH